MGKFPFIACREFHAGFELSEGLDAKVATPAKALFDLPYHAPGRSSVFSKAPELNIRWGFRWERLTEYTGRAKAAGRRAYVTERIEVMRAHALKS